MFIENILVLIMPMVNRIKQFTKDRGITVYRFIKETGISPTTGYALARDTSHVPSMTVLTHFCDVYKVQPMEFIVWKE